MIGLEKGKVILSEYDINWPLEFENEKIVIQNTLTENDIRIEHIGSTSVENLCAKPIIDILVGINHFDEGYKFASLLEATGYSYKGENGIPGRHFFVKGNPRTHHLHIVEMNSVFFSDHLLFRDYLRKNPEEKNQYAVLKKSMAVKYVDDREKYTDSKAEFIQNILRKAKGNDMKYDPKIVKLSYDKNAAEEDKQEKKASLRTEIPREFIKKYLKKSDVVLDAGGGTGINSIMMAKICKRVTLIDISSGIVKHAMKNVKEAELSDKVNIIEGDICNLKQFKDGQFSFIVCVGDAISYVLENRFKAMAELVRVAKKNSILVIGCDSKYGFMRLYLQDGNLKEAVKINKTHETYCGMGPRTHVYSIDEMKGLLEDNGCEILEVASTPTITDAVDKSMFNEPKIWNKLKKLEMDICTIPELLGTGNHLLFIARKK